MRLRSIELHGYKSFAARTALQFDSPLTAVVGPNGSGKSNVMDGLRWAIGAGTGRALRARRAEDVVFSGGRDRAPSGFAEVRVKLDNGERWLDLDAAEVEIVRRVHRDGQSDIRINGRSARLRDVQDLFRNSGLGSGGFALMSQGLVDEMLRLRPAERRQAIEEVSGVRHHRHQMEESRRRRERAQEHLERARLLRDELSPRLKSLERAARRARQVQKLRLELSEAQRDYFLAAATELEHELAVRRESSAAAANARKLAEAARASATEALSSVEREAAASRQAVESAAENIRGARNRLRTLEHQQELDQQQHSWLQREIADLSDRVQSQPESQSAGDVAAAEAALAEVNQALSATRDRRDRLERNQEAATSRRMSQAEMAESQAQATQLARRWRAAAVQGVLGASEVSRAEAAHRKAELARQQAEARVSEAEQRVAERTSQEQAHERRRADCSSRIAEIDAQIQSLDRRFGAANTLRSRVYELTDDHVRADAVFGELMDATLHESREEAIELVRRIVDGDAGRAVALPVDRADDFIRNILDSVDFTSSLDEALRSADSNRTAATPDGIVVRPDGVVLGGGSLPGAARLRQQINQLRAERAALTSEIESLPPGERARQEFAESEAELASFREEGAVARAAAGEARELLETLQRQRGNALTTHRALRREIDMVRGRLAAARTDSLRADRELADTELGEATDIAALEQQRDERAAFLAEARAQAASADRARSDRARLESLQRELVQVEAEIRAREPQLEAAASTAEDTAAHDLAREQVETVGQRRAQAARQVEATQESRLAAERDAVEADAALRESETSRARLEAEAAAEGIDLSLPRRSAQSLLELNGSPPGGNGDGRHVVRSRTAVAGAVAVVEPQAPPVPLLRDRMLGLQDRLQRLGPVDPGAASEYDAEHERWRDIEAQINDLEQTEQSLREAERDLEQQIERRFRDACRQVDEAFQRYFQLMFRGGRAELVLTEEAAESGEDGEHGDSESQARSKPGVDIRAQPPGKRVSTLGLLSGGERALTAIALLFALLEVRPAPFCILDEVDAALDEANVERFVSALKERARHTQFVVITHNRRTIEQADSIYGVTMGAAGVSRLLSVRVDQAVSAAS